MTRSTVISLARLSLFVFATITAITGCGQGNTPMSVNVDTTEVPAGHALAGRFYAQLDPEQARIEIYPLHADNTIRADELLGAETFYDYSSPTATQNNTCTPGNGAGNVLCDPGAAKVRLYSLQSQVSYASAGDGGTVCMSNGVTVPCSSLPAHCQVAGTFCAPVQIVSGYAAGALPDPVLIVSQVAGGQNSITGCLDDTSTTPVYAFGKSSLCASTTWNSAKVDSATTSSLSSKIKPASSPPYSCSYCYGNINSLTTSTMGLRDALITSTGTQTTLNAANKNLVAFRLQNNKTWSVTFELYYGRPAIDTSYNVAAHFNNGYGQAAPGCLAVGTTSLAISGGGFGPPSECLSLAASPYQCPVSSTAGASGTSVSVGGNAATVEGWSDTSVTVRVPSSFVTGAKPTVTTPISTATSSAAVDAKLAKCGSPMNYRSLSFGAETAATTTGTLVHGTVLPLDNKDNPQSTSYMSTVRFSVSGSASSGVTVYHPQQPGGCSVSTNSGSPNCAFTYAASDFGRLDLQLKFSVGGNKNATVNVTDGSKTGSVTINVQ